MRVNYIDVMQLKLRAHNISATVTATQTWQILVPKSSCPRGLKKCHKTQDKFEHLLLKKLRFLKRHR